MQYLTYEEYKQIGGTLEETAFKRIIIRVCGEIDSRTKCRVLHMEKVPENVKALCADLVDYYAANVTNGKVISSKSTSAGPVSESESYTVKTSEDVENDLENMIYSYLGSENDDNGTPLLYRGCSI